MLEAERFNQVSDIFEKALRCPLHQRDRFIDDASGDASIASEVRQLLAADESNAGAFLDTPAMGAMLEPMAAEHLPEIGDRIGRYTITGRLGAGGMGVVYAARQESPRRDVALKMVAPGLVSSATLARFEREAEALGRLEHAGIARIYEAGEAEGRPYIVMELVRGRSLIEFAEHQGLGARERMELVASAADAVQHAHQKGVIHRDLKPANLLVEDSGALKILDFGVSAIADAHGVGQTIDESSRRIVGTVSFMSPEQASSGVTDIDTRTDVYALGVLAYQLLCGRLPIDVSELPLAAALRAVSDDEPARLGGHDHRLRGDIETVVHTAIAKDPSQRYQSAAEFASDLRRVLRNEPIAARRLSTVYQLRKLAQRHRPAFIIGAVAAIMIVAATALSIVFGVNAHRAQQDTLEALGETERAREAEALAREGAEQRLADVRRLVNALLFDIDRELDGIAGATVARERVVRLGLEYMDKVVESSGDDPEVLGELARGYLRLGDIYGSLGGGSMRNRGAALEVYERALEIYRRIINVRPDDLRSRVFFSVACKLAGESAAAAGDIQRGRELFNEALAVASSSVDTFPDDYVVRRDYGLTYAGLADLLERQGRWESALANFERSHTELLRALDLAEERARPRALRDLQSVEMDTATVLGKLARPEEALEIAAGPLRARRDAATASPESAAAQSRFGAALAQTGRLHMAAGQYLEGLALYEEALDVYAGLVARDPDDRSSQFWYTTSLENVGDALHKLGRSQEARDRYRECQALREGLAAENPEDVDFVRAVALAIERVADMDEALGEHGPALSGYEEAARLAASVLERSPDDGLSLELAMVTAFKHGEAILDAADRGEASDPVRAQAQLVRAQGILLEMQAVDMSRANALVNAEAISEAIERAEALHP